MLVAKSIALFVLAAIAEIGGAWLVWQGVREHTGWFWIGPASSPSAPTASSPPCSPTRTSAASWPPTAASSWPARWPGAWSSTDSGPTGGTSSAPLICLVGVAVIMYAPRAASV